jgi:hypothetical protein
MDEKPREMKAMHPKPEPNQHVLIFLHPILLCGVTYRALLLMLSK